MKLLNVVKIDLCGSKVFMSREEAENPAVRQRALEKLLEVSKRVFPQGEEKYPEGTFYKADGDAVFYLVDKSTVALRGAIEFMQDWFREGLPQYPECKVFLDRGPIDQVTAPGHPEIVGKPFENISVFEKSVDEGKVYLTRAVLDKCDQTMAKFVFYGHYDARPSERVKLYYVDFVDPRTVEDTSLIHALFVAHPKAAQARDRLFELFAVEYLLQFGKLTELQPMLEWARQKNYPMPGRSGAQKILDRSSLISKTVVEGTTVYALSENEKTRLAKERGDFRSAHEDCLRDVRNSVVERARSQDAIEGVNLASLVEEYLCSIFSEIRMMANYFRETRSFFQSQPEALRRFDYIIKRHLPPDFRYFNEWRDGFIRGLKAACEKSNLYIAAVFHNVLATYYLNRSTRASPYQEEKVRRRQIYLDTNVLYSLLVPASCFHEVTMYFAQPLRKIGVVFRIFPFTLQEYEMSLSRVVNKFHGSIPSEYLVKKNPWLYQQFMSNPGEYLQRIEVCRLFFSIAKGLEVNEENFEKIEGRLKPHGVTLERKYKEYTREAVEDLWTEIRGAMDNLEWDLAQYWEFLYSMDKTPEELVRHDVYCIQNAFEKSSEEGKDDLGHKVMFLTTDGRKLLRLRKKYPFILSPEQFLEFILPYLFLGEIPVIDPEKFPNQLLSAELGTLLVRKPPEITQMIAAFLNRPGGTGAQFGVAVPFGHELGALLNDQRFNEIREAARDLDDDRKTEIANAAAGIVEEIATANRVRYYQDRQREDEMESLRAALADKKAKIEKLEKTVRYWKQQARL